MASSTSNAPSTPGSPSPTPLRISSSNQGPLPDYYQNISEKRRKIQEKQDDSLIHGLELQPLAERILKSNDLSPLQEEVNGLIENNGTSKTLFDSFCLHYPSALSLKLVKLLERNPIASRLIRSKIINLLHRIFTSGVLISFAVLIEVKIPLLNSVKSESCLNEMNWLCEVIGSVSAKLCQYRLGGWEDLYEYVCMSVSNSDPMIFNQTKGLMLLAELAVEVAENREFWIDRGNYLALCRNVLKFVDYRNEHIQELAFGASLRLIGMSKDLERTDIFDSLLTSLLRFIDGNLEVNKVRLLYDLVTLDVGKIFERKESAVFWCMIRLAESEGASEELKIMAVNVVRKLYELRMDSMQSFMKRLSSEEVERVFAVSVDMMSCIVEDPVWYEIDNQLCEEAGMADSHGLGRFLLKKLVFQGDQREVVPKVIKMLTVTHESHHNWQTRYAVMVAMGIIANGDFKGSFEDIVILLPKSLDEQNDRVIWSTIHAIKCLGGYKELLVKRKYYVRFLKKLLDIINRNLCSRVQECAIIAIRVLVRNCGLHKIENIGEEILAAMLVLVKHEKQKVQEEAIETLTSIAVQIRTSFRKSYYDSTMKVLKDVLVDHQSSHKFLLGVKCLECMGILVWKIERDKFEIGDVDQVVKCMVSLDRKLINTDYLPRIVMIKALDQFFRLPKINVDTDRFIDEVMPMLLASASAPVMYSRGVDWALVQNQRIAALNILFRDLQSSKNIPTYIHEVIGIFARGLRCSTLETREVSTTAVLNILQSIKVGVREEYDKHYFIGMTVLALLKARSMESDRDLSTRMLQLLSKCIKTFGSLFDRNLIKLIANEIMRILEVMFEIETSTEGTSEGWGDVDDRIYLLSSAVETFRAGLLPHVDTFLKNVSVLLDVDSPDRVIAIALSVYNAIVPRFPDELGEYHDNYAGVACHLLKKDYPSTYGQLHAVRAIAICAKAGKDRFKTKIEEAVSILYSLMEKRMTTRGKESEELTILYDTAVAALGRICDYHAEEIDYAGVVEFWLEFLPLKGDPKEAKYAHGLLSRLLRRPSDKHLLLGSNKENLPKIISVIKEILSPPAGKPLAVPDDRDIKHMINFIDRHGGK